MKKLLPLILTVFLLAGCTAPAQESAPPQESTHPQTETQETTTVKEEITYRQIDMQEAIALMESETGYVILDVRTPEEFAEKHIPNAINIPNETIGREEIPELPDKNQMILVYCRSGNRSKQASEKLAALGYTNVLEFGGIIQWPGETVTQ